MLKKTFLLFGLTGFLGASAQDKVQWEPDIQQALDKAKATGKVLFVEAYLPTCPACQAMEPNFSDPQVAARFNTGFVNYKMDLSVEGARKFLDDRRVEIPSFPQFLFFDGEGKLVHHGEAHPTPASVLEVAADALDPEKWSSNYRKRFDEGYRDFTFLVKFGAYTRVSMDTLYNPKVVDALYNSFAPEDRGSSLSWSVTKKVVNDTENGFFRYWIEHIPEAAALEKAGGHAGNEMNTLGLMVQRTVFSPASKQYSLEKVDLLKSYMEKVGAGPYADFVLWEHRMLAQLKVGKKADALATGEKTADIFRNNGASLIYLTHIFNDNFPDNDYVPAATKWLKTARPMLKENAYLAEYHYELGRLNRKSGDTAEATKNATEALRLGRLAGIPTERFEALLNAR
ncbi:MAG: DUF255 domain-containing protein [Leadbetterella sp.]|nr:DUF255 domain-containing protein [Leadbetterella sp.]